MGCEVLNVPGVGATFVCRGRSRRRANCDEPDCGREHVALCDRRATPRGRRCSRRMCDEHRTRMPGDDVDFCPRCVKLVGPIARVRTTPMQLAFSDEPGLSLTVGGRQ